MADVTETPLPGVGVRHDFTTDSGERVGVIVHRNGRRELVHYDRTDPDVCRTVMYLSAGDSRIMAELLGASRVAEAVGAVQHDLEGLSIDWITVPAGAASVGHTIGEAAIRTRTGVSIVAVLRQGRTLPAPGPEHILVAGDVAVAVGTPAGLEQAHRILGA